MTELRPCNECHRHVAIEERACPFCGSARTHAMPHEKRFMRVSRAVAFAGAALATSACGGNKPKTESTDKAIENHQPIAADAGVVEGDESTNPRDERRGRDPSNIPMPYGAPPARRRLV